MPQIITCWRKGFLPESWVIYQFDRNLANNYLSDFARLKRAPSINGSASILFDSKLIFSYLLKNSDRVHHPEFYIENGRFISFPSGLVVNHSKLGDLLEPGKYVVKPSGGGGGEGIQFFEYFENNWSNESVEYTSKGLADLKLKRGNELLIYKQILQTGFANQVYPWSLNTVRMLTMVDPDTFEPFVAAAVFRSGVKESGAVDNWSSGGLSIYIDPQSGVMGKGVTFPRGGALNWFKEHPDTGFHFYKMAIPNWKDIQEEVLIMARQLSFIPYIAWDVVPMTQGFIVLEANSNSDVNLLQVHEPLLNSQKIKKFYRFYKVI